MITDERINEIADKFIDIKSWDMSAMPEHAVKDFARALLAEVSLDDILEKVSKEIQFVYDNEESFLEMFVPMNKWSNGIDHVSFSKYGVKIKHEGNTWISVSIDDYIEWKRTIQEGGE